MVKEFIVILALAAMAWAQNESRPPCEHRGFFFGMSVGLSYTSYELNKTHNYLESSSGSWSEQGYRDERYRYESKKWNFSGFDIPKFEFRFGASIANHVALYSLINFGLYRGETEFVETISYKSFQVQNASGVRTFLSEDVLKVIQRKDDAIGLYFSTGLGVSVYPIANPKSPWNGFYVGFASGLDAFAEGFLEDHEDGTTAGIFTRYEIGKDWWVSETWSVGVAFAYQNLSVFDDDYYSSYDGSRHTVSLLFRLTRG